MLFGRGHWAIFGIKRPEAGSFLTSTKTLTKALQDTAIQTTKAKNVPTTGINPFAAPRLDETTTQLGGIEDFKIGDHQYGFWLVFNDYEDVTDPASKKEQIAYTEIKRPFK